MFVTVAAAATILAGATSVLGANSTAPRACGSTISDEALAKAEAHFAANRVSANSLAPFAATIDVCSTNCQLLIPADSFGINRFTSTLSARMTLRMVATFQTPRSATKLMSLTLLTPTLV
jgi:hypothetical protein